MANPNLKWLKQKPRKIKNPKIRSDPTLTLSLRKLWKIHATEKGGFSLLMVWDVFADIFGRNFIENKSFLILNDLEYTTIQVNLGIGYKNWDVIDLAWYCTMVCSREFFLKLWTGNGASNTCTGVRKAGLSQILKPQSVH